MNLTSLLLGHAKPAPIWLADLLSGGGGGDDNKSSLPFGTKVGEAIALSIATNVKVLHDLGRIKDAADDALIALSTTLAIQYAYGGCDRAFVEKLVSNILDEIKVVFTDEAAGNDKPAATAKPATGGKPKSTKRKTVH